MEVPTTQNDMPPFRTAPKLCARVTQEMYEAVVLASAKRGRSYREIWLVEAISAKLSAESVGASMASLPVDGLSIQDVEKVRRFIRFLRRCGPREEFKLAAEDGLRAIERLLKDLGGEIEEG